MLTPVAAPTQVLASWEQGIELVRSRSTSVGIARARITEAEARSRQALSPLLPQVSANGGVRRELLFGTVSVADAPGVEARVPNDTTFWNGGLSLSQSLINPRAWYDLGTTEMAERAAEASAEDSERRALGLVADTIVSVITAERLAEVTRVSLRSNLSVLDLTQRRARLGAASAVDVLRAEQEVVSNRADVVQADESVRRSREALGLALGFPEAWGVTPDIKVDGLVGDARALCTPITDTSQRADVRAAQLDVEVAQRTAKSSSYAYAPTLDLVSDLTYTNQDVTNNGRPVQWSIGAVLSIPIFDGGRLAAERRIGWAGAEQARQQLTETSRQAHLEVVQAQRAVEVAIANYEVSRNARAIAEESARLSRIAFMHGTGTSFDLVESARRLRLAELDLAVREFEVLRARITALLALSNCSL